MNSMLIAISPKPLSRRITKFNKRSWWYSYKNLDAIFFLLLYEISKSVTFTSRSYPGMGMMLSKTLDLYLPTCQILMKFLKGSWWYSYINLNTKNFDFFMTILSLWPWPQGHSQGGDGADKNFRPISTIMPNMNEIHQRVFKIWGLINFNTKTLTQRQK